MLHQNGAGYPAFWGGLFRVENAEGLSEIPSKRLIRRALGHEYEVEFEAEAQELRIPLPEKACLECVRNGKSRCRGGEVYRNCGREFPECDDRPCWRLVEFLRAQPSALEWLERNRCSAD